MAAEAMGFTYEQMKIVAADTETTPHDFGAYASRQTLMSGAAVKQAGEEVKAQLLEVAGEMLDFPPEDLEVKAGRVFSPRNPEVELTFGDAARRHFVTRGPLVGKGSYTPPKLGGTFKGAPVGTSPAYSFAAQVSEVEVDEETGEVTLHDVWDVHDCGMVINPALLHAQVHGALFMGMGEAIWEQVLFDDKGRILNPNLGEYRLPTALDMPRVHSALVESFEPAGPWGVKEVGEGATLPTMGCFANAITNAVGVRIESLPLTYEKVWRALRERDAQAAKRPEGA